MRTPQTNVQRPEVWQSKAHRAWFYGCAACLAAYIAYAAYLSRSGFLRGGGETIAAFLWFAVLATALFRLLHWGCRALRAVAPKRRESPSRLDPRIFFGCAALSMALLGCALLACYPGGVSYDAANQWTQMRTGAFNNWHPVFHTLLVWLTTRIWSSYAFAVLAQIAAFSLALGYAAAVLRQSGVPGWLVWTITYLTAACEPVRNGMMYLWKDNAMTIGCLVLCAQCVRLVYSRGDWLRKPGNAVCFGLALAFTTLVRHNALLFTLPLLALVLGCYGFRQKGPLLAAGVFVLCAGLVLGPLYAALDIVYPSNTLEEAVGLPMAVLGNAKREAPEALDEETNAFLAALAPDEAWRTVYRRSDYNSIKFTYFREYIKYAPAADLLRMAARTAANAPRLAFETVNEVTDLVWGLSGLDEGYETVSNSGDLEEAPYGSQRLHDLGKALVAFLVAPLDLLPLSWLTRNIGAQLLLLLLVSLWALYRGGVSRLVFALPVLCYDLATMLLLCGQDARFFQFTMAISLPAMAALIYAPHKP